MKLTDLLLILDSNFNNRTITHCKKEGYEDAIMYTNKDKTISINGNTCNALKLFILVKNDVTMLYLQGANPYNPIGVPVEDIDTITIYDETD